MGFRLARLIAAGLLCLTVTGETAMAASVSPPPPPAPPVTAEQTAVLSKILRNEAEPDRLKRCLDAPDPPAIHWNRATVTGFCHLQFDKYISLSDIRDALDRHDAAGIDKRFAKLAVQQHRDVTSMVLDETLDRAFACSCKEARDVADRWKAQSPKSPWAYAASGIQYSVAAYAARGNAFIDKTPPERLLRMDELNEKSAADLDRALAIAPDLTAAAAERISIDREEGRTDEAHNAMIKALERNPASYELHMEAVGLAQPKWGGTPGELEATRRRVVDASRTNPMLLLVVTFLDWKVQQCEQCKWDMRVYQPMLETAPSLAVLRKAGGYEVDHGEFATGAIYLSELLRFSPTDEVWGRTERGTARAHLGDIDGARSDAEASLEVKANFQPAMHLLSSLPPTRADAHHP